MHGTFCEFCVFLSSLRGHFLVCFGMALIKYFDRQKLALLEKDGDFLEGHVQIAQWKSSGKLLVCCPLKSIISLSSFGGSLRLNIYGN